MNKSEKIPFFSSIFVKEKEKKKDKNNKKDNIILDENDVFSSEINNLAIDGTMLSSIISNSNLKRNRFDLLKKWQEMEQCTIISNALKLNAIAALGGHESKGDVVFIEPNAYASDEDKKLIEELENDLLPMFNDVAFSLTYKAIAFGDAYLRTYYREKQGLVHIINNEQLSANRVLSIEKAGVTVGYLVGDLNKRAMKLNKFQIARLKMPRLDEQEREIDFYNLSDSLIDSDDFEKYPARPALLGGSFLNVAIDPFDNFYTTLSAIVGQRWVDSIDESMMMINISASSPEQQKKLKNSIKNVLLKSKEIADKAQAGKPFFQRIRHLLFTTNEKQIVTQGEGMGSKRQGGVEIEDVMLHARMLSGALGVDLSMIGFADQLSGGLGDGGFFRVSAQIAESSRVIRISLAKFFDEIIDNHLMFKYGKKFIKNRPFDINFYGSISAFESEKQRTRADAVSSAGIITQTMASLKELGFNQDEILLFLTKEMLLDSDESQIYAKALARSQENNTDMEE